MVQVLYPGLEEAMEFDGLLEAFEHVVKIGKMNNFLIKKDSDGKWEDGGILFRGFQGMFSPA